MTKEKIYRECYQKYGVVRKRKRNTYFLRSECYHWLQSISETFFLTGYGKTWCIHHLGNCYFMKAWYRFYWLSVTPGKRKDWHLAKWTLTWHQFLLMLQPTSNQYFHNADTTPDFIFKPPFYLSCQYSVSKNQSPLW